MHCAPTCIRSAVSWTLRAAPRPLTGTEPAATGSRACARRWRRRALVNAIEAALADVPPDHIRPYVGPEPKRGRAESAAQAVARVRNELGALATERAQVVAAPIPSAAAK